MLPAEQMLGLIMRQTRNAANKPAGCDFFCGYGSAGASSHHTNIQTLRRTQSGCAPGHVLRSSPSVAETYQDKEGFPVEKITPKPARLALFGGSFDPVHCGHLKVAHCALEQSGVDRVVFIPASQSPLKHQPFAVDADRLQMLRLALQEEARFELNTFDLGQDGRSFTIDTVDHFRELYRGAELFWIIGEDQFAHLDKWRCIHELAKKITFLVYPRLENYLKVKKPINGLQYILLKAKTMPVSSTEVRERCEKGLSLRGLVPDSVKAFIDEQGLYKQKNNEI